MSSLGFSALVNQPTQIFSYKGSNSVSCSTLDHLITNSSSSFSKVGILIADVSDHLPIFASMTLSNSSKNGLQNTYRRTFPDNKEEHFVKCLEKNLSDIDFNLNPNQIMDNILLATKNAINLTFPIKKCRERKLN